MLSIYDFLQKNCYQLGVRIVVVGAGEVGYYITRLLTDPKHQTQNMEVAIIDADAERVSELAAQLDATMVEGSGSHPESLQLAGIDKADLLVAVSSSDEVNLIAGQYAKIQGVKETIVRVEAAEIKAEKGKDNWFLGGDEPDLIFDPDQDTANEIYSLLDSWGAEEIATLGEETVVMIGVTLNSDAEFCGKTLSEIGKLYEPDWSFLVAALRRDGETKIPRSEETLQDGDHIWLVIKRSEKSNVLETLGFKSKKQKRILLLGGGRTAEFLAKKLVEKKFREVTLIEQDAKRAKKLAARLDGVDVVRGDITDAQYLSSDIDAGKYDAAIALTGKDEANVLACMYAKSLGTDRTIAILHRLKLLEVLGSAGVDSALSPVTASANRVLRFVHEVEDVATFLGEDQNFEVVEIRVEEGSKASKSEIKDMNFSHDALVGAIVRDGEPSIARGDSELMPNDLVLLIAPPEQVDSLRKEYFLAKDSS